VVEIDTINILKNHLDKYWTNQEVIYDFNACLTGTGDRHYAGIEEYLRPPELIGLD